MKHIITLFFALLLSVTSFGQIIHTQTASVISTNSHYVHGWFPSYSFNQNSTGPTFNLLNGTTFMCNSLVNYSGGHLTLTANATNVIRLDTTNSCAPTVSTNMFALNTQVPPYVVTTNSTTNTNISDVKTPFNNPLAGGGPYLPLIGGTLTGPLLAPNIISSSLPVVNVLYAGIVGDGLQLEGCSITSGNNVLTCPTATFSAATDIDKGFAIGGAGPSGSVLVSTITSVNNASQVTLSTAASTTQTNTNLIYGTNNTNSWCAMVNCTSPNQPNFISSPTSGRILRAPRGTYLFFRSSISTGTPPTLNTRNGDIIQGDGGTNTEFVQIDNTNEPAAATADFVIPNSFNNAGVITSDSGGLFVGINGVMFQQPFNDAGGCINTATSAGAGFVSGAGIRDNWFVCNIGMKLTGNLIWVDHNTCDQGTSICITMSGSGTTADNITHDITISKNDFFFNHTAGVDLAGGTDIWVVNNWFSDDTLNGAIIDSTASNFRYHIRNNDFNASTSSFAGAQLHINVTGNCKDCDIEGNTFEFGQTNDVTLANSGIVNLTMKGNKYFMSSQAAVSGSGTILASINANTTGPGLVIEDERFNTIGQYGILASVPVRLLHNQCNLPFQVATPIGGGVNNFDNGCFHFTANASGTIEARQNTTTSTTGPVISLNGTTTATVISSENTSGFATCAACFATNQANGSWVTSWNENSTNAGSGGQAIWESFFNSVTGNMSLGGSSSVTGNMMVGGHINQSATNGFAGTCTMSSGTSCTITLNKSYSIGAICVSSSQTTSTAGGASACALTSSNVITITATTSNSLSWGAVVIGNPD